MIKTRNLKLVFAFTMLIALFISNLYLQLAVALALLLVTWKRQKELQSLRFLAIFAVISFLPWLFDHSQEVSRIALLIFFRSLILYSALILIAENISLDSFNYYLGKIAGKKFAATLTLAFNLLPTIRQILTKSYLLLYLKRKVGISRFQQFLAFASSVFRQIIAAADNCAESMLLSHKASAPQLFIITGNKQSGKTTHAAKLVEDFTAKKWPVSGILSPGEIKNGIRSKIYVKNIQTGESKPWASRERICPFKFSRMGMNFATRALLDYKPSGIVFLDEFGPMEFAGKGYAKIFAELSRSNISSLYVVVRKELLEQFISRFVKVPYEIIDIER